MRKYDVSIIVVNYNGRKYLYRFFESLTRLETDGIQFEVVFVDNASGDDSVAFIRENGWDQRLHLKIVENVDNQGFAQGNNTGVANAEGEYIVFLNNDTAVDSKWLTNLYRRISTDTSCGIVTGKLLFFYDFLELTFRTKDKILLGSEIEINGQPYSIDSKFCTNVLYGDTITCFGHTSISISVLCENADFTLSLAFEEYDPTIDKVCFCGKEYEIKDRQLRITIDESAVAEYKFALIQNAGSEINEKCDGFDIGMGQRDSEEYSVEKELMSSCGASLMMRKADFDHLGGFDAQFFMYYEDTDLSFRLRKMGKKIIYCPTAVVRHIHTGSSKEWSPMFCYHVFRNKLLFVYKNIGKGQFVKHVIKQYGSGLKHRDKMMLRAVSDAVRIAIFKVKGIKY